MFRHRQQLQMRIPHVGRIIDQFIGQIAIGQKRPVRFPPPGTEMHFVNVQRPVINRPGQLPLAPCRIGPFETFQVDDPGSGVRPHFRRKSERIGLDPDFSGGMLNRVLVKGAGRHSRSEQRPHPRAADAFHAIPVAAPVVEIPLDPDIFRVRGPHGKARALPAVLFRRMGAENGVGAGLGSFMKQIEIGFSDWLRAQIYSSPV